MEQNHSDNINKTKSFLCYSTTWVNPDKKCGYYTLAKKKRKPLAKKLGHFKSNFVLAAVHRTT
jgi:hypothetical protein